MISPDAWAHQYVSMSNQPWALPLPVSPSPFFNVDNRGLVFGLEPHFPCCTVNHPQGLPKFLAGSWMITRKSLGKVRMKAGEEWQDELVHGMLGPSHVKTILREMKGGTEILNAVKVRCETAYPFEQVLVYHITAKEPLDISLRIPSWVDLETSSLRVHDRSVGPLSRQHPPQITLVSDTSLRPAPRTRLHALRLPAGYSTFTLTLGAALHIEERNPGMVAVHYGPLLYALDLRPVSHWVPPVEWQSHAELPAWRWMGGGAHDEVVLGTSPWNVAIDLGSLRIGEERKRDGGGAASGDEQFFMPENGPTEIVEITVMACEVEWEVERGVPAPAPVVLQSRAGEGDAGTRQELNREKDCIGPMRRVRFVPFGQAKVRMTELPVVDLGWGGRR